MENQNQLQKIALIYSPDFIGLQSRAIGKFPVESEQIALKNR